MVMLLWTSDVNLDDVKLQEVEKLDKTGEVGIIEIVDFYPFSIRKNLSSVEKLATLYLLFPITIKLLDFSAK